MDDNKVDIKIVQIADPWNFQAIDKPESLQSPTSHKFQLMHQEMNQYCNQLIGTEFFRPNVGDICGALSKDDGLWHRVKIEKITLQSHGQQICCFMIDRGSQLTVSTLRMMKLPKKFLDFPSQVHQCCLWGVQPVTLKIILTDTGLSAKSRPCNKWDPAAIEFMQKMVIESQGCQAEIINQDSENTWFLRLYFITRQGLVHFNETLVNENYAIKVNDSDFDFMHKLTKLDDTAQKDNLSSLAPCNTKILQSVMDDMPSIVPYLATNLHDQSFSKVTDKTDSLSFTTNHLLCLEMQEQSKGQQCVINDSSMSSAQRPSYMSMNPVSEVAQEVLPSPELKLCTKSPTLKQNSLTDSSQISSAKQMISSQDNNILMSSQLAKLFARDSLSSTVTNVCLGRGRAVAEDISTLLQNNPTFSDQNDNCKLFSCAQSSSQIMTSSAVVNSNHHSSPACTKSPSHVDGIATSPLVPQSNHYSFLSGHSPSPSKNIETSPVVVLKSNHSSFLADHSPPHAESSGMSPVATLKIHSSSLSSHFPLHLDNTETSSLVSKSSHTNTVPVATAYTNVNEKILKNEISGLKSISLKTFQQSNSFSTSPEASSNSMKIKPCPVGNIYLKKPALCDSKGASVKPRLAMKDSLFQSNSESENYLSWVQEKMLPRLKKTQRQDSSYDIPLIARQDRPFLQPVFGVLIHGKSVPSLICNVDDVPFKDCIKSVFRKLHIETAKSIQAWVWPTVLSCRHIVGICPPNLGKTMSYVPAVVSQLLDYFSYSELPPGKGPIALIIVPSWRKARNVLEMVKDFADSQSNSRKKIRSHVLYAGGIEENDNNKVSLLQGCDILISTPKSLLNMLDQDVTSLKRLCHLILDDSEILSTRYAKEVENIMHQYKLELKDRKDRHKSLNVPKQIMIFSTKWSAGVEEFYLKYTVEPIIVISSRVEASVYGGVRQIVTMAKWEQRLNTFCGLLDTLSVTNNHVTAFSQDVEEAVMMYEAAKSRDVYCLLIHQNLLLETISEVREQWLHSSHSKHFVLMVCTDQCYEDLAITNATMVIHYGLPDSKTKFGNRLACMMDYFLDRTSYIKPEIEPVSQIILTNRCVGKAECLYEILQRCSAEFSPQLEKCIQGYKIGQESDPRKILCPFLKSFGKCSLHWQTSKYERCDNRHLVIPEHDFKTGEISENTLPSSGEVKIKVMRVENASSFYCHLIQHRSVPDNVRTDLRLEYQRMVIEMVSFFSRESNHIPFVPSDNPFLDDICAFKDNNNVFHRAKVLDVCKGSINTPMKCSLWLVDAGYSKKATMDQLLRLPQRLAEVPYQAVEVYLCCVKPMDNDSEWTHEANDFMNNLIQGKELVGRIMLRVGMTLWLLPLVHQVSLKNVGVATDINVRQELLGNNLAIPNPDHIQKLYELFRGNIEIPEKLMRQYFDYALEMEMLQETLTKDDTFYEVNIAAVISPGLLYVQKWDNFELLEKLEAQIADVMRQRNENNEVEKCKVDADMKLKRESVCLALSSDGRWYRAKIVSDNMSGQWEVFFLDYGDKENVSESNLRPLPRELAELPCQAIECELAYIQPHAGNWAQETVDVICDLAYCVNRDKKQLSAKVVSRLNPHYGIGQKLVIDLYNDCNVRFSQELVWRHMAKCAKESDTIKELLGKPAIRNQLFFLILDKIPYLCANIYWCEIHSDAIQQANELCDILSIRDKGWESNLIQREVLASAFKVIGYIPDIEAHAVILDCLVSCCLDSDRLIEIAVSENLSSRLAHCFEQVSRPKIQLQAVQAIAQLVNRKSFCDSLSSSDYLVNVLIQFLYQPQTSHVELETLQCVCYASTQLLLTDERLCTELRSAEMVEHIFFSLQQTSTDPHREPWLKVLATIATWESTHKSFMREAHVAALMNLLQQCSCCKCIYYLLSVCQLLVQTSRRNKVVLLENKLLIILNDLEASGLRSPALEVCKHLQADMSLTLPKPEGLAGLPAQQVTEVSTIVSPYVTWSQNCFKVVLNVKVRDAKVEDFLISETRICCRCISDGVQYELDWELYDLVLPVRSKVQVYASHSLVSLRKQTSGIWSRLLKQKMKLPNLSHDFEHPYDSAEEDVDDETNITALTKKKEVLNQEQIWKLKRIEKYQSSQESSDELACYSHSSDDDPTIDF